MAKRKPKYQVKAQPIDPKIKRKFELLIKKGHEEREKNNSTINYPKGEIWRWDTLEDVNF